VVEGRGCSSVSMTSGSPFFCGITTGTISSRKSPRRLRRGPALLAAQCKGVLVGAADVEVGGHVVGGLGIEWVPYSFFIAGFGKRQPMVVS
jgi:hypothetical protein